MLKPAQKARGGYNKGEGFSHLETEARPLKQTQRKTGEKEGQRDIRPECQKALRARFVAPPATQRNCSANRNRYGSKGGQLGQCNWLDTAVLGFHRESTS